MKKLIALLLVAGSYSASAATVLPELEYRVIGEHKAVDFGSYISKFKDDYQGNIYIIQPSNIHFKATLMDKPKAKNSAYVQQALQMMQVSPMPTISHQMFLGADDGQVIAVYVDQRIVAAIDKLPVKQTVDWFGYHIYNFSKGPALVIENFESTSN